MKKQQKYQKKELFNHQSNLFLFGGCPKFPSFDNLAKQA